MTHSKPVRIALLGVLLLTTLAACAGRAPASEPAPTTAPADPAADALRAFFAALHEGRFEEAVTLYGGEYGVLHDMNPDVSPTDYAVLFERYCTQDGGVCLPLGAIVARDVVGDGAVLFRVQFTNDDGSVFAQGPCCGEPDTGARTTDFAFTVLEIDGPLRVMALPPYVP